MPPIALLGATGNVGSVIATALLDRGIAVRVIGRSAEKLRPFTDRGAEFRASDVNDLGALARAFEGASAAFALMPPNYTAPDARAYIGGTAAVIARALRIAKVPRAALLSSLGADREEGNGVVSALYDAEAAFRDVPGLHLAILRPTFFMENLLSSIGTIRGMGVAGGPWSATRPVPMVATRDIGAYAARLLAEEAFEGVTVHEILGPRDYTQVEAARIVGAAIGKPELQYVQFPAADAQAAMVGMGMSPSMAAGLVELATGHEAGNLVSLAGRSAANTTPTTLEQFAAEVFAPAFRGAGG
ncbi:MAG: NAD(P)H-binding protein [Gemmatimonadales bacterium]|nr:NAD(P)H-binding protein [Gemmatimonadales bacterium]